jgi:hypothetical protein
MSGIRYGSISNILRIFKETWFKVQSNDIVSMHIRRLIEIFLFYFSTIFLADNKRFRKSATTEKRKTTVTPQAKQK